MEKTVDNGVILQMQDYSIHDGEGVRTTIFLAGCPLRCRWCANPESWTTNKKLIYYKHKCMGCNSCNNVCPNGLNPSTMIRPNSKCSGCGDCVSTCVNGALKIACTEISVKSIVEKIKRDELFFRFTKGGVIFSGGEPFTQHRFLRELTLELSRLGIDMWVETCGYFNWEEVSDIMPYFSTIFIDIKHMDSILHEEFTGVRNEIILDNIKKIYDLKIPIIFRIPAISGFNMTKKNILDTAIFISENAPNSSIEILPYHELGKAKYFALGIENEFFQFVAPTNQKIESTYEVFKSYGIKIYK